jgi:pimeloyl-ACP methyl ester carboxylesterase
MQQIRDLDLREQLQQIQVPVLIVAGEKDKLVPSVREARLMSEKMQNSKVIVISGHGHACLLSQHFHLESILESDGLKR